VLLSVIVTTYNQPQHLERVLWGYAAQRWRAFELVVADDGSDERTAAVIDRVAADTRLDVTHVWHADRGFRKPEILNRAIVASRGEYLVFTDGDCIPRDDFLETHVRLAEPRRFLSGGYLKLPAALSERVTVDDVRAGRATDGAWLRAGGWRPGHRALRAVREPLLAGALDAVTPTRRTWNGHNASTWRSHVLAANGFDMRLAYGGLDRAFGELLTNAGVRGKQIRHRAVCVHLHHERPYVDHERWRRNRELRARIRREGTVRALLGLAELDAGDDVVVRRAGLVADVPLRVAERVAV
jgi:glycosyltransferase involved in cell wall biosynthesis